MKQKYTEYGLQEQEQLKPEQPEAIPADLLNAKIADASKTIFSYCMSKTANRLEAEDLCQDILLELVRSSESIRDIRAFYGFMWAVAGNVYKHWCRNKAKPQTCELTEDIPEKESALDKVLADEENSDLHLLRRELTLLSEKYRQAVILYYIKRKSCSEIAQSLSVTESKVKYLLFKSRKILKEGMIMERKLGTLSYNPKTLIPMYHGSGTNRFWEFMQSKVRQNIVNACYNDSLTPEQISLETGIPLPYLDSEINALSEREILIKDGSHYKANVIILTTECTDEIDRSVNPCHQEIAGLVAEFLEKGVPALRQIGFSGGDFSDDTLRWQLITFYLRECALSGAKYGDDIFPLTAWGDHAYLWLEEKSSSLSSKHPFNYCTVESRHGDLIHFIDYLPSPKSDHHDFYGNDHAINTLCDIAHNDYRNFNEYDLETVAELIQKGYVLKKEETYSVAMPLFTQEQYAAVCRLVNDFAREKLEKIINAINQISAKVVNNHTPRHLQSQVPGIAGSGRFVNVGSIPLSILIDKKILNPDWNPMEMPTMQIRLNK
ncbi:MAG: sigma-70 family RNA polymerase sigma factor [Lachnospiraceae bacterium]|nr:sigma-70 family RNA polymerase sigma factor [Lachnospiraceae bacterium]